MSSKKKRILIVDDNPSIHDDFQRVLVPKPTVELSPDILELESDLFDEPTEDTNNIQMPIQNYHVDNAYQGEEAIRMVDRAEEEGLPYSLIFMDVRMPPGIDGIQTTSKIWEKHKNIEVIICTAYSDYSWDQIIKELGSTSHLLFLKKPFDTITVRQMALSLTTKWDTERKNKNNLQQLKSEVEKRTSQLENMIANLEKIRVQSEKNIYSKSVFLSSFNNEFRSPLNGIMGMTDLLLNTDLDEEQKDFTKSIKNASDSLLILLNNVLDFTKIETGKTTINNIEFYLRTAAENVTDLVALKCAEKNLKLVVQTHSDVPDTLIGDAHRIRQIFLNLCTNAVKHTEEGEISIKISVSDDQPDKNLVKLQFEIEDTGPGFSADEIKQLFSDGSDNSMPDTDNHSGMQLRYAISRKLIKMMGGEIGISSITGKGTTICFNANFQYKKSFPYYLDTQNCTLSGVNCLILGDNPTSRKVMGLHINKWGGEYTESSSKENAVDKLQSSLAIKPYEIVIIDLKSSKIEDYIEIKQYIDKFANLKDIHLVCLSSDGKRGDTSLLKNKGYSGFLTKPIKHSHLFYCLLMIRQSNKKDSALEHSKIITKYFIDEFVPDRYRFLICDNNPDNCKDLSRQLNRLRINCDFSNNIDQLDQAMINRKYDAIFIEDNLINIDLDATIQNIKTSLKNKNLKIFVTKTDNLESNDDLFKRPEIASILLPPFSFENIDQMLNKYLKDE